MLTLSRQNVFETAKLQPCSKERLIIAAFVAGGAEANPNGFSNFIPQKSTEISTSSIGVWKSGNFGSEFMGSP